MAGEGGRVGTRSSGPVFDLETAFPKMKTFLPATMLPTLESVVGMLRYQQGGGVTTKSSAIAEVAKQIYAKWYHDSIPCTSPSALRTRLAKLLDLVQEGSHRYKEQLRHGKGERKVVTEYKELVYKKERIFDIFPKTKSGEDDMMRKKEVEEEWGVTIGKMEEAYLQDQRTNRQMECGRKVDPVWYHAVMRKQREREKLAAYREERERHFQYQPMSAIEQLLREDGELSSDSDDGPTKSKVSRTEEIEEVETEETLSETVEPKDVGGSKKMFVEVERKDEPMPEKYKHVRISERKVKDETMVAIGNLVGEGLSVTEATKAVVEVGNVMFDRSWKIPSDDEQTFDIDTLPIKRNIREALRLQEAQDLDLMVDQLEKGKEEERPLTMFSDSTTKRGVGQFVAQGIHVGRDNPFPLPILSIDGETTGDIVLQVFPPHPFVFISINISQVDMALTLVAAVRGTTSKELYKLIDTHMTDATEHNKRLAELLQEAYDLDQPAGQLFCGTHTTLGFAAAMNKFLRLLEAEMKMDMLVQGFMVDLDVDSKNSSVAGQSIDMCLRLVAPEYNAKPWNKNKEFLLFLEERGVQAVLFSYKDSRFGCLSRAAAVLLYHWGHLQEFLSLNPSVNNRLACLVREVMDLPYLKPVLVVVACLGVHLVEPFYTNTINTTSTHSSLKLFYRSIYTSMEEGTVSEDFYSFSSPLLQGVNEELFEGVKKSYKQEVLAVVTEVASEHKEEVVQLAKGMLPHLSTVLARQRRDYGIDEERFPAQCSKGAYV